MLKPTLLAPLLLAWITPPPTAVERSAGDFELRGAAAVLDEACIRLTPDAQWAAGAAWSKTTLDLGEPFDLEMQLRFGATDALGADGIVFVLAPEAQRGWRGEGIGYAGIRGSLGIELDTYQNRRQRDPAADHLGLLLDGAPFHRDGVGPVVELPNLEDGRRHAFRVTWSPDKGAQGGELKVFLDGVERATYSGTLVKHVLGEGATVSWGLTAGTGRKTNPHDVCFEKK